MCKCKKVYKNATFFLPFPNWHIITFWVLAVAPTSSETNSGHYILSYCSHQEDNCSFILLFPPLCSHSRTSLSQSDPTVTNWLWLSGLDPQHSGRTHIEGTTTAKSWLLLGSSYSLLRAAPTGGLSWLLCVSSLTPLTLLLSRRDILIKWAPHDASRRLKIHLQLLSGAVARWRLILDRFSLF